MRTPSSEYAFWWTKRLRRIQASNASNERTKGRKGGSNDEWIMRPRSSLPRKRGRRRVYTRPRRRMCQIARLRLLGRSRRPNFQQKSYHFSRLRLDNVMPSSRKQTSVNKVCMIITNESTALDNGSIMIAAVFEAQVYRGRNRGWWWIKFTLGRRLPTLSVLYHFTKQRSSGYRLQGSLGSLLGDREGWVRRARISSSGLFSMIALPTTIYSDRWHSPQIARHKLPSHKTGPSRENLTKPDPA